MASWATTKHRGGPEPDAQTDGARSDRDQHGIVAACRRPDPSGDERRNRLHDVHWGDQRAINGAVGFPADHLRYRSEEHTSELQSLMRISYAVFCLKKKTTQQK